MEQKHKTKDLHEAAALVTCGCRLVNIEKIGSIAWFVFDGNECSKLANDFYFGGLEASLKLFSENLKTLKGRLFARE